MEMWNRCAICGRAIPVGELCYGIKNWHGEPTNADRIRAMSDEELAKFFDDLLGWTSDGYEEHLNWLRKPAKED